MSDVLHFILNSASVLWNLLLFSYREIWEIQKDAFIRRYQRLNPPVSSFDADIYRCVIMEILSIPKCQFPLLIARHCLNIVLRICWYITVVDSYMLTMMGWRCYVSYIYVKKEWREQNFYTFSKTRGERVHPLSPFPLSPTVTSWCIYFYFHHLSTLRCIWMMQGEIFL